MRYIFFVIFFLSILNSPIKAQNLIQNSSFERFKFCPVSFNNTELDMVRGWNQPTAGTVDYYNTCSVNAGVPKNVFGNQLPKTGKGYIGLIAYAPGKLDYREYIQSEILLPLDKDEKYCMGYYASLADYSNFGVDGLGMVVSNEIVSNNLKTVLNVVPSITGEPGIPVVDSEEWILINGVFTANGGEQYVTIGNFYNDSSTVFTSRELDREKIRVWDYSYYYIDDIFLIPYSKEDKRCIVPEKQIMDEVSLNKPEEIEYKMAPESIIQVKAIYFPINRWELDEKSIYTLIELAEILVGDQNVSIEIVGHADQTGETEYNMFLSKNRADAAYNFLLQKGVPEERLNISYHGEHIPISRDKTNAGLAKNRRVEFVIYNH